MSIRNAVVFLAALASVAALAGCYARSVPDVPASWLRAARPEGPDADGYGAWIAFYTGWGAASRVAGELIACDADSVWVLSAGGLVAVAARRVHAVTVTTGIGPDGQVRRVSMSGPRVNELRPWTRFPQGIPAGLDRALIRPRPWLEP